jgi:hypothetical protein
MIYLEHFLVLFGLLFFLNLLLKALFVLVLSNLLEGGSQLLILKGKALSLGWLEHSFALINAEHCPCSILLCKIDCMSFLASLLVVYFFERIAGHRAQDGQHGPLLVLKSYFAVFLLFEVNFQLLMHVNFLLWNFSHGRECFLGFNIIVVQNTLQIVGRSIDNLSSLHLLLRGRALQLVLSDKDLGGLQDDPL